MRAAVVPGFGEPLVIEDRPIPSPGSHQVLVRMEASGLCHTDIHAWRGGWPVKPTPPFVPGHEGIGIVEGDGPDVSRVAEGDRVAIPWLGSACGTCEHCVGWWETLCEEQQNSGYSVDGAYAEYALADSRYVGIPEGVDPRDAAPLSSCSPSERPGVLAVVPNPIPRSIARPKAPSGKLPITGRRAGAS